MHRVESAELSMGSTVVGESLAMLDEGAFTDLAEAWENLLQRSYDNRVFVSATWYRIWWGMDVASTMSFHYRERYLLYNSSYAPTHAVFSNGIAAVTLTMQDAVEARAIAFDFLSGDEPYEFQFGASSTHTCRVDATRT